ncbi:MAG: hypothetical protein AB9903_01265 [Vulcanimicrobiota bacterium]
MAMSGTEKIKPGRMDLHVRGEYDYVGAIWLNLSISFAIIDVNDHILLKESSL